MNSEDELLRTAYTKLTRLKRKLYRKGNMENPLKSSTDIEHGSYIQKEKHGKSFKKWYK